MENNQMKLISLRIAGMEEANNSGIEKGSEPSNFYTVHRECYVIDFQNHIWSSAYPNYGKLVVG